ncbi:MAG TPA: hypothetical protein VEJ84_02010, partial [Acidimicrobiales bacterium]|nr:hypothetical protein [Acidimicrobiales bacterium]
MQQVTLETGAHLRHLAQSSEFGQAEGPQSTRPKLTLIQGGALTDGAASGKGKRFAGARRLSPWDRRQRASVLLAVRRAGHRGFEKPA